MIVAVRMKKEVQQMEQNEINQEIMRILDESKLGSLTTMKKDGQPFSRYMIFRNEGYTLYAVSSKNTDKVRDILNNKKVHILIGFSGFGKPFVDMTAEATIHEDESLREKFWHENFRKYLEGPDDPNYVVIRCEPAVVRLMSHPQLDGPAVLTSEKV
ncbi:pyridoxamine 5'-phosphate oxidase family protein [Evansella clarkii]|uniref:pyridoxamine 5'-phosphate oxidase family protein n=1 Tax=Evansella clarkii TaxID=79879 RepID=UPI001F17656D|nr:pyridoxamine 5'-phosphate oxidase family protein [Evansella clarkii]